MQTTIRIYGEVKGTIWMPACECTKEFDNTYLYDPNTPDIRQGNQIDCLRDALLKITNDGDFQGCGINWAFMEIIKDNGISRKSRTFELFGNDGNKDCYCN